LGRRRHFHLAPPRASGAGRRITECVGAGAHFSRDALVGLAIGGACVLFDLRQRHGPCLVYSTGLKLDDLSAATPISAGCTVCEQPACPQRAFPQIGRALAINENHNPLTPYMRFQDRRSIGQSLSAHTR
ncbi:MAG: DUF2083 domain-containing protein, partial [Hyphomonadaceae bacterium]|nr:DUF2083 domain-containing protein [Hyphomonadaceae bacterium]